MNCSLQKPVHLSIAALRLQAYDKNKKSTRWSERKNTERRHCPNVDLRVHQSIKPLALPTKVYFPEHILGKVEQGKMIEIYLIFGFFLVFTSHAKYIVGDSANLSHNTTIASALYSILMNTFMFLTISVCSLLLSNATLGVSYTQRTFTTFIPIPSSQ